MSQSKASPRRTTAVDREREALRYRMSGLTYAAIGEQLGVTEQGAYKAVMRALGKLNAAVKEEAEELRRLELERLDKLQSVLWVQALQGNQGAADRILRIMERRAKLKGLDAPTNVDVTSKGEKLPALPDVIRVIVHSSGEPDDK